MNSATSLRKIATTFLVVISTLCQPVVAAVTCQNVLQPSDNLLLPTTDGAALRTLFSKTASMTDATANYVMARLTHAPYVPMSIQSKPGLAKLFRSTKMVAAEVAALISPVPGLRPTNEITRIFDALIANPHSDLSQNQKALLEQQNAFRFYQAKKHFLIENPGKAKALKNFRLSTVSLLAMIYLLSVQQTLEMSQNTLNFDDYPDWNKGTEDQPAVHLLIETTPLPHTALRIGDRVYSYGVDQMTVSTVHEYMSARSMVLDEPQEQGLTAAQKTYQSTVLLLVKGLERQVRFVELKLSAKEIFLVQRELESNNLKLYRNTTMVNDCSTMIFRVLSKYTSLSINPFVDAYPTTAGQYLGLLKKLGNTQVGSTGLVLAKESNKPYSFVRNTYVAFIEGNIMISSLLLNAPQRAYVSLWIGEDGLQWWSDENKESLEAWKTEALKGLKAVTNSDEYLKTEIDKINLSAAHLRTEQRKKLKEHLHQQLRPLKSELLEAMGLRDLSIESIVSIQAKLAGLVQIEQEWFDRIDGK